MTADIDAVLSRLRERPECRDAVEVIEELRRRKATDDGAYEHVVGLYHAADEALRVAERDLAALTAERDRLREAIRWHRLAAEETVGVPTDDHKYYEPFDHALWAALGESPVPDEPTQTCCEWLPGTIGAETHCAHWHAADDPEFAGDRASAACCWCGDHEDGSGSCPGPSHPTGEERDR